MQGNCKKCGKSGHNVRTCKGEVGGNKRLNQSGPSNRRLPKLPVRKGSRTSNTKHERPAQKNKTPPTMTLRDLVKCYILSKALLLEEQLVINLNHKNWTNGREKLIPH